MEIKIEIGLYNGDSDEERLERIIDVLQQTANQIEENETDITEALEEVKGLFLPAYEGRMVVGNVKISK